MKILLWLMIAVLLERTHLIVTKWNYGSQWNGYGAVTGVLRRDAQAPMVYRVLVPWLLALAGRNKNLNNRSLEVYEGLKILFLTVALWATARAWSDNVALLVAVMLPATFWFDYWDWTVELAGVTLVMTGELSLALVGLSLWVLSRETALIGPVGYAQITGDLHMAGMMVLGVGAVYLFLRLVQGEHKLYCDRFMIRRNWDTLKKALEGRPVFLTDVAVTVLYSVLTIIAVAMFPPGWLIPLGILVAGWVLAVAAETRIFVPVLPWIGAMLL